MPKETPEEIEEIMRSNQGVGSEKDKAPFVADHTGYGKAARTLSTMTKVTR